MFLSWLAILGWTFLLLIAFIIIFFILMAQGIIKRTDATVRIEHFIEDSIGLIFKIFFHKLGGGILAKEIEENRLKFKCTHCGYPDDVDREFCLSCNRNAEGFYIEQVLPYKCNFCFNKFSKPFTYCPKCNKNAKGIYENGSS